MSEQSEPVAETEGTETEADEAPEGAEPALASDPILGDQLNVGTIGPGDNNPAPGVGALDQTEEEAEEAQAEEPITDGGEAAGV